MMYGNCGQMPERNLSVIVCESRTGSQITPYNRKKFTDNHWYSVGWKTIDILNDLREFVAHDCKLDY